MSASPIRGGDGKLAITPGVWRYQRDHAAVLSLHDCNLLSVAGVHLTTHCRANGNLIAEAGTVTNATNRTPAELLKERDEWEAEAERLKGELDEIKEEVRQARRKWIGDDAGHLSLAQAIEFVRDRDRADLDEWEAEAVKLKYTLFQLRKALDCIAVNPKLAGHEVRKIAAEALAKSENV